LFSLVYIVSEMRGLHASDRQGSHHEQMMGSLLQRFTGFRTILIRFIPIFLILTPPPPIVALTQCDA
jgi:hypothetical protein